MNFTKEIQREMAKLNDYRDAEIVSAFLRRMFDEVSPRNTKLLRLRRLRIRLMRYFSG
jgi:hypothetical protein